ncbi:signal peptidase I [Virgibacillus flavescens]|uniref:signal peptidase I n=1 Tax=Virgibacillus flavescens TaxID=1611422 RepID=UPI003D35203B
MDLSNMQISPQASIFINEVIQNNGCLELPAEGTSMYPLIQKGDVCLFKHCDISCIKRGDIVLFQNFNNTLICHRFIKSQIRNNQVEYICKGDTNFGYDKPFHQDKVIGKLASIRKGKVNINATNTFLLMWGKIILFFPFVTTILRIYLNSKDQ